MSNNLLYLYVYSQYIKHSNYLNKVLFWSLLWLVIKILTLEWLCWLLWELLLFLHCQAALLLLLFRRQLLLFSGHKLLVVSGFTLVQLMTWAALLNLKLVLFNNNISIMLCTKMKSNMPTFVPYYYCNPFNKRRKRERKRERTVQ